MTKDNYDKIMGYLDIVEDTLEKIRVETLKEFKPDASVFVSDGVSIPTIDKLLRDISENTYCHICAVCGDQFEGSKGQLLCDKCRHSVETTRAEVNEGDKV